MATKTGTTGNDFIYGGGPDTMIGLQGDDTFVVYSPADTVVEASGEGNDTILTFSGYTLAAGASVETLSTAINSGTTVVALAGNALSQIIVGNNAINTLDGRGGGDALVGLGGTDIYIVYGRNDLVVEAVGGGNQEIVYSYGDFVLGAGSEIENIYAAEYTSTAPLFLGGNEFSQAIIGNAGNNTINSGGGADRLAGADGDDVYRVFGEGEEISEGPNGGNDAVFTSRSFALSLYSGSIELLSTAVNAGTETINLTGNSSAQTIIGNYGNNVIDGGGGADVMIGLVGDDVYRVYGSGEQVIESAGQGNDTIFSSGNYVLRAGQSIETLSTASNSATAAINLTGNELAQTIIGNFGANVLDGGAGSDVLYGLTGADTFRFSTALGGGNVDTLADFGNGQDTIQLDPTIFAGLTNGQLAASAIAYGAAAADADDRIVYNPQTGALSFDSDGSGSTAAVQFAALPTGLAAAAIAVSIAPTSNAGPVRITGPGTYLLGGATGSGTNLDTTYPDATSFTFSNQSEGAFSLAFGPNSYAPGRPPITFETASNILTFDFSQLGTGITLRPTTDFLTTGGAFVVTAGFASTGFSGFSNVPRVIVGSPFDDYIDQSPRAGQAPPAGTVRDGGDIRGGAGNDTLEGARVLDGGSGDDLLIGLQSVRMTGGTGADVFRLPIYTNSSRTIANPNEVVDFGVGADRIELLLNRATDLAPGALPASRFAIGTAPTTGEQRVLYDPATGNLRFDSDGTGGGGEAAFQTIFARLSPGLDLSAANFSVVPGAN